MKRHPVQITLMVTALLAIAGFQAFWLQQSYKQEKKALELKTDLAFRNAIQELQVKNLKLDNISVDSPGRKSVKIMLRDSLEERLTVRANGEERMITSINVIRKKMDTLVSTDSPHLKGMLVTRNITRPSMLAIHENGDIPMARDQVYRFLYGVDSLQDSLTIPEITAATRVSLARQKTEIPFHVERLEGKARLISANLHEVTLGFANPLSYRFIAGNTLPYLIRQMMIPIGFSIFLFALTLFSFAVLYRNLVKQSRLTAIKNEFIGNITHELKTPISTVGVALEAIRNFNAVNDPVKTAEYLGYAEAELKRLNLLVDKVLRISMFENQSVDLHYTDFDLALLADEVLASMNLQLEKSKAIVNKTISGTDFMLRADRLHISSVLYNLLDNAIRYSGEHPQIDLALHAHENEIELVVADKGPGIDPRYQQKIFEKFFRVPQGNIHNVKGYGLGLSYVSHIIASHKGSITVNSDGKTGSAFIIKLPRSNGS